MQAPIFYFVDRQPSLWKEWADLECPPLPSEIDSLPIQNGNVAWIVQTYLYLRNQGINVRLVDSIQPGAINVIHYDHLNWKRLPFRGFVVAVQADRPRPEIANMRIVQNHLCIRNPITDHYIPHWTQPGLQPRDSARGTRLERLAYYGLDCYLSPAFRHEQFKADLERIGISFEIFSDPRQWSDYKQTDAILAVREVKDYDLSIKPPTKLLNAFRAGCIPLMGPEPAYRQVAIPNQDYFEVQCPEQVIKVLEHLKSDSVQLQRIQEIGRKKSEEYTAERIALMWENLLQGPVFEQYLNWKRGGTLGRLIDAMSFPARQLRHSRERTFFFKNI